MTTEKTSCGQQEELAFLRKELASLQIEHRLMQEQVRKVLELVADSRNAFHLAMTAQATASEALVKVSQMTPVPGVDENLSSQNSGFMPFDNNEGGSPFDGGRLNYLQGFGGDDPVKGQ